jgi:hypothetical protein
MGYKVLGFVVWRGARWYLGRKFPGLGRKLALGGAAAAVAGGAIVAGRQLAGNGE